MHGASPHGNAEVVNSAALNGCRPYQEKAIVAIDDALQEHGRTLLVMATGTGKTRTFSTYIARRNPKRVLVLVHREELLTQARDAIASATGWRVLIERAEARANLSERAVVAMVQTLARPSRLQRFPRDAFDLIVVDEAHHAAEGNAYSKILDWFHEAHVLGVTATPDRHDEKPLGKTFRSVAFEYEIDRAIGEGFLCPIKSQFVKLDGLDRLHDVHVRAGDFVQSELDGVYNEDLLNSIGDAIHEHAEDRQTIAFTVSVRQAQYMAGRSAVPAAAVHGEMDRTERRRILEAYGRGEIRHIYNVAILTEGTDLPATSCIAMARPTMSRALYAQMLGRGLRISPNKSDCLVLDFVGNTIDHDVCCIVDALGVNTSREVRAVALDKLLTIDDELTELLKHDPLDAIERAVKAIKEAQARHAQQAVAQSSGTKKLVRGNDAIALLGLDAPPGRWGSSPVTEKQAAALQKFGVDTSMLDRSQASTLFSSLLGRAKSNMMTLGQARFLARFGVPITATRSQASRLMELARANRWQLHSGHIAQVMKSAPEPEPLPGHYENGKFHPAKAAS